MFRQRQIIVIIARFVCGWVCIGKFDFMVAHTHQSAARLTPCSICQFFRKCQLRLCCSTFYAKLVPLVSRHFTSVHFLLSDPIDATMRIDILTFISIWFTMSMIVAIYRWRSKAITDEHRIHNFFFFIVVTSLSPSPFNAINQRCIRKTYARYGYGGRTEQTTNTTTQ